MHDDANDIPTLRSPTASGIWHLAPQTTFRPAMTDYCHVCEGPIAAHTNLPQATTDAGLMLGPQPYPTRRSLS